MYNTPYSLYAKLYAKSMVKRPLDDIEMIYNGMKTMRRW